MGILVDTYGAAVSAIKGLIGKANGIASLGADGKVPAAQLPTSGGGTVQDATTLAIKATDEGSPAGNTRGGNAVDLQSERDNASEAATGDNSTISGGENNTASAFCATVSGGIGNVASSIYATTAGGNGNEASGGYAFVGGGSSNTASGGNAVVCGGSSSEAGSVNGAIVGGSTNAIDTDAFYAFIGAGQNNTCNGSHSFVPGGFRGLAQRFAEFAHAPGRFSADGDAQRSVLQLFNSTTDATQTEIFTNGSTARCTLANTEYLSGRLTVFARRSNGDYARWTFEDVTASRIGSANVTVDVGGGGGSATSISPDQHTGTGSSLVVDVNADTSNQALRVQVTGNASENWRWHAIYDAHRGLYGS